MGLYFVSLFPKTKKGREITKRLGNLWIVIERRSVSVYDGQIGLFIRPFNGRMDSVQGERWVREKDDEHFVVETGKKQCPTTD